MKKNDKKGIKPLKNEQMLQVRGGYREVRGRVAETISVRWYEISIRFQDDEGSSSRHTNQGRSGKKKNGFNSILG